MERLVDESLGEVRKGRQREDRDREKSEGN